MVWPIDIGSRPGIARRPRAPTISPVITSKMMNVSMTKPYPDRGPISPSPQVAPFAWRLIALIAVAEFALLIAFADGYGFHRDELYFMEAGKHPAFGYDDQPPLTPLIARAATWLFGSTPTGLRVPSALALAACVFLAALTAREFGAGRRGQVVASLSIGASAAIYIGHLVSTTTYDFLAWTALLYLAARIIARRDPRLWLAFGLVLGIALLNKWLVASLVVTLALGLVVSRRFDLVRNRWVLAGAVIALALWLPNLIWQADHGWPQRELASQIADEDPTGTRIQFLPFQLIIISPLLAYVWIRGLLWLLRSPEGRRFRALGLAYVALLVICVVTGAKEYYAVGFYPALLAAGGVAMEQRLIRRRPRLVLGAAVAVSLVINAFVGLPLIPASSVGDSPVASVNDDVLETIGWPRFADWVAANYRGLPAGQRRRAVIFTANYGEAGAIQQYGPSRGLPRAYSGHNSFTSFGRPPAGAAPVLVIGYRDRSFLDQGFRDCRVVSHFDNGYDVDNEEQGTPLAICAGPRAPWPAIWPRLHHLDA